MEERKFIFLATFSLPSSSLSSLLKVPVVEECKRDLLMVSSPDGVVRQIGQWFEITCDTRWNVYNLLVKVKMPQRVCECANGNIDPQQHSRECISVP